MSKVTVALVAVLGASWAARQYRDWYFSSVVIDGYNVSVHRAPGSKQPHAHWNWKGNKKHPKSGQVNKNGSSREGCKNDRPPTKRIRDHLKSRGFKV